MMAEPRNYAAGTRVAIATVSKSTCDYPESKWPLFKLISDDEPHMSGALSLRAYATTSPEGSRQECQV